MKFIKNEEENNNNRYIHPTNELRFSLLEYELFTFSISLFILLKHEDSLEVVRYKNAGKICTDEVMDGADTVQGPSFRSSELISVVAVSSCCTGAAAIRMTSPLLLPIGLIVVVSSPPVP